MTNINDYIIKNSTTLTSKETIHQAQSICENYPISHIIIVENDKLIGCFPEKDIRTIEDHSKTIETQKELLQHFNTDKKATLLELISIFANNDCNLIPVLDDKKNYIGYYDLADILDVFTDSPFLQRDNESLIIQKTKKDYSMSQVAQIVESNGAKILGIYVSYENNDYIELTLKIKTIAMNELLQTFRRYDYDLVTQHIDDIYIEELKDRANYFKKFLDI